MLYCFWDKLEPIFSFDKPKYIKDNYLPDVAIGLGKQPSNNESTEGDADLLLLLVYSWEKVIYIWLLVIGFLILNYI